MFSRFRKIESVRNAIPVARPNETHLACEVGFFVAGRQDWRPPAGLSDSHEVRPFSTSFRRKEPRSGDAAVAAARVRRAQREGEAILSPRPNTHGATAGRPSYKEELFSATRRVSLCC